MRERITAACVQVEPVIFDRSGTIDRVAERTAEAAGAGAALVVFPETFIPAYPSSAWAKALAGWAEPGAKEAFALLHRESLEVPGPDADVLWARGDLLFYRLYDVGYEHFFNTQAGYAANVLVPLVQITGRL